MSRQRAAGSGQRDGADGESAPAEDAEVVDAPVADAEVVDAEVVDAEVVEEESCVGREAKSAEVGEEVADDTEPDPLADALRERAEYLELAQRARADFDNYRRRVASQTTEAEQRGRATLARGLLPALDNLQRALAAAGVDPADPDLDGSGDGLAKGVALVYGELLAALARGGVVSFDPAGEKFDPNLHEAVSTAPAEGAEPGSVLQTLELGYRVDRQVIRPARVVVSG